MDSFASLLRAARAYKGLEQWRFANLLNIKTREVAKYEDGRAEPAFHHCVDLLQRAGIDIQIVVPAKWAPSEVEPTIQVPERLPALPPAAALRTFEIVKQGWIFADRRSYNLADRKQRIWAYQRVLERGNPEEIATTVDGVLLCQVWSQLELSPDVRRAWAPLVEAAMAGDRS